MDVIYDDSKITNLSLCIISGIKNQSSDLDKYIELLRRLYAGSYKGFPSNYLTNAEIIKSILCLPSLQENIELNPEAYLKILTVLLDSDVNHSWHILSRIVTKLLKSELNEECKKILTRKIWNHKDFVLLPVELVISIIEEEPILLETHLIHLYKQHIAAEEKVIQEECWKKTDNICWIRWCSQSSAIFCIITSLMNEILLCVKDKNSWNHIITNFIDNLIILCQMTSIDFTQLYPLDCQSFINLLLIDPDYNPCKTFVIYKLKLISIKDPNTTVLLLSHFKEWRKELLVN